MSIRNAGAVIREARKKAGFSRDRLSEGICSEFSLSRIENGKAGISPSTFQKLMERAGVNGNAFPVFASKEEYLVFRNMLDIRYYLDCWQLDKANESIMEVEKTHYAENKFYYQQCQLYKGVLLLKSHTCNYNQVQKLLLEAIQVTYPELKLDKFHNYLFSVTEIELLIALAECLAYLGKPEKTFMITERLEKYLDNTQIAYHEKSSLKAKNAIAAAKALIQMKEYKNAYETAELMRKESIACNDYPVLHELTFLTGVCQHYFGNLKEAYRLFEICYYSAYSTNSIYSAIIREWTADKLQVQWKKDVLELPAFSLKQYTYENITEIPTGNGIYDLETDSIFLYQLGDIIRDTRREKRISQEKLCKGLCNRSALSKIENNVMYPNKFLAEVLLQRLGIYSDAFTIFGDAKDFRISELKKEITVKATRNASKEIQLLLQKFKELLSKKDAINYQFYSFVNALTASASDEAESLQEALNCTLPDFDFDHIKRYCLSYNELTILNNLIRITLGKDPSLGIKMFYEIKNYHNFKNYDVLEKNRTYLVTIYSLFKSLYNQKRYQEILKLIQEIPSITNSYHYLIIGRICFFYCQALGELQRLDEISFWAKCSWCNLDLIEQFKISALLKEGLYNDFNLKID